MAGTSSPETISTKEQRLATLAQQISGSALTTLHQYINLAWLKEAYRRTRKDGAPGIDGQMRKSFEANLEENLERLLNEAKSGTYRAPAVRRAYIPKGDGKSQRPLGIPTLSDKVLQRAVVMVLEPIYEQQFKGCSYGYRPQRSAHQALEALRDGLMEMPCEVILEVDLRDYFGSVDHRHIREMMRQRIRDGVILRLIGKWLNAGVMEGRQVTHPETGTPQGGVISPLLANIYLHEVLDAWFESEVKPRLRGKAVLVRYCDDFVIGFSNAADGQRVRSVLEKRLAKYGLSIHPEKTRLIRFEKPSEGEERDDSESSSFSFLGFTHYWGKSRRGYSVIFRKTAKDRFRRAVQRVATYCRRYRHEPVAVQHRRLCQVLIGHYNYYGITANARALTRFRQAVERVWQKWLNRRSQKRSCPWTKFVLILGRYELPPPRIVHHYT